MKKLLLLSLLLFCGALYSQETKLLASCCDISEGRCSGTSSCSACTNCRYCKHCSKEGGSCGVCSGSYAPTEMKAKKQVATAAAPSSYKPGQMLEVRSETLNVRKGPHISNAIIEKVKYGDMLTFVNYEGDWIYVKVNASGQNGWVNYKYVK